MTVWDSVNVVVIFVCRLGFLNMFTVCMLHCVCVYVVDNSGTFDEFFDQTKKCFSAVCVDLRFILIEADFNEARGRGELLSSSNFVSSLLSDQPLAVTEHS